MKQVKLWMLAAILVICGATVLTSCTNDDDPVSPPTDEVETQLQKMTLREKVGQLFYVRPECLDTNQAAGRERHDAGREREVPRGRHHPLCP